MPHQNKPDDRVGYTVFGWTACRSCVNRNDCDIRDQSETDRLTLSLVKGHPIESAYLTCDHYEEGEPTP